MTPHARPKFGKGVKLRREDDGTAMLLVPEGALVLNAPAAETLALIDGARSVDEIVSALVAQFDVDREEAREGVDALLDRLAARGFVEAAP